MADQSSYPQNDGEWTYDVALNAVTGASFDITKPAAPDDGWFTWKNWDANGADIWYKLKVFFHWDTLYALNYNTKALKAWGAAVDGIEAISNEVRSGNYGQMSVQSLYDFETLVATAGDWLNNESADFHKFATDLKDPNSGVQGSAGDVIAERLKHYGDWLDDLHTQLTTKNGVGVPSAVQSAHDALTRFGSNMADAWEYGGSAPVWSYLSAFPGLHIDWWTDQVYDFTDRAIGSHRGSGHSLNYYRGRLSQFPGPDGTPLDITTQATWDALSNDITTRLKHEIKGWLDGPAVQAMTNLRQAYEASSTALVALVAPAIPPISMPGAGAGAGDPGLGAPGGPPDAAAGMPGGLDPGAGPAGGPDAGAGAPGGLGPVDTAAGPAGGLPDLGGGPPGGPVDVAAGPAGGFDPGAGALDGLGPVDTAAGLPGGLPDVGGPPGGPDVAAGPAGGFDPTAGPLGGLGPVDTAAGPAGGFDPGAGALGGLGPVDTAAGLPGGLPDLGGPPGGPDVAAGPAGGLGGLIPGVGPGLVGTAPPPPSTTDRPGQNVLGPPPRGTANGQSLPSDAAQGLHPAIPGANGPAGPHLPELRSPAPGGARAGGLPGLGGPGGVGGLPGSGLTGVGGAGDTGGLAGRSLAGSGLPGSGLPGTAPSGLSGSGGAVAGSGAGAGPAGASGDSTGGGGVPFFPPMMGGAGAGAGAGEKPQERERQTWLSEDEDVWGTDVDAGSGVIGRFDDVGDLDEALVAALPGQDRIHPAAPRRGGSDQPERTAAQPAAAQPSTEE